MSDSCTLNDAYVGSASFTQMDTPFNLLDNAKEKIFINTDQYEYKTTIGAQLGFRLRLRPITALGVFTTGACPWLS